MRAKNSDKNRPVPTPVNPALTKRDRVYLTGSRNITRIRFRQEAGEDENEPSHTRSRPTGDYLRGISLRQPAVATRIDGVVIGLPSLALLVLAQIQLGGSFSVRPKAQALVTHGLYSRIRNPISLFGASAIERR
jgi:hypothetical protein